MAFELSVISIRAQILTWCFVALCSNASAYSAPQQSVEAFQRQIKKRFAKDQSARMAMEAISKKDKPLSDKDHSRHQRLAQRAIDIDASNVKWLKTHVAKSGLPAPSLIGADVAERMFILLIHADRDRKFQKQCVELMEASPNDWPAWYPQRLKTRMSLTAPLKLEQTEESEKGESSDEQTSPSHHDSTRPS